MTRVRIPAGAFTRMEISFFEEFPTKKNLEKLKLIKFKTKIYVAASNLKQFYAIKRKIKKLSKNVKKIIYWLILNKKDGYWISPFSRRKALKKAFEEIKNKKDKNLDVMLDLEPPYNKNLFLTELLNFLRNRKLIKNFIKEYKRVICAELSYLGIFWQLLGLSYKSQKKVSMYYSSVSPMPRYESEAELDNLCKQNSKTAIGLGCIAVGISGKTPLFKNPEELDGDLSILKGNKIKEAVIFRLGGLNKEYLEIIKKYL